MLREVLIYLSVYIGLFAAAYYFLSFIGVKRCYKKIPENKLPMVSIIIPAYNEEKSIKDTVMSALNLDYPKNKLEIIVVDDGSIDRTYSVIRKIRDKRLRVFRKKNRGKGAALNYGIRRARGEIIITMDADTFAEEDALKKMVYYFSNPKVMCVAPSMAIYKPRKILERIQQIEYLMGVFLRKAFSSMNAIHITPGAFSAYRKKFFDKYGLFDENNITEDMEMSLRIQYNDFIVENSDESVVYTKAPSTFLSLLKQRRRWYYGLTKNLWHYRKLFSRKYGQLGMIVLPVAATTILFSIILTSYLLINTLLKVKKEIIMFNSINFNFSNIFVFNKYIFERWLFLFFSKPITIFFIIFSLILVAYLSFAKSRVTKYSGIKLSIIYFLVFFYVLFAFWWIVSLFYVIFVRKISWGK